MTHFAEYCKSMFNNKYDDPYKNYINSYSVFLTSRKYPIDDIKNYRKKAIINNYLFNNTNSIKEEILSQYNINDDNYNTTLTPTYNTLKNQEQYDFYDNDDDIEMHYNEINNKYEYYNNICNKNDTLSEYTITEDYRSEYSNINGSDKYSVCEDDDYYDDYEYVVEEEYMSEEETDEEI